MTRSRWEANVTEPNDWVWPVSYRYTLRNADGDSRQLLTVDLPGAVDEAELTVAFGLELWRRGVALATTRSTTLLLFETLMWKGFPLPVPKVVGGVFGLRDGPACPRADTPHAVFSSGHGDDLAQRRFPLFGAPASWVWGRKLTHSGMAGIEVWLELLSRGLSSHITGAPARQLLAYENLLPAHVDNIGGVGFRPVASWEGCSLTERAPDLSTEPWP